MTWFWVAYISIGTYILIPAIVQVWNTQDNHPILKIIASLVTILVWPLIFFPSVR